MIKKQDLPPSIIKQDWEKFKVFLNYASTIFVIAVLVGVLLLAVALVGYLLVLLIIGPADYDVERFSEDDKEFIVRVHSFCNKENADKRQYQICLLDNLVGQDGWDRRATR